MDRKIDVELIKAKVTQELKEKTNLKIYFLLFEPDSFQDYSYYYVYTFQEENICQENIDYVNNGLLPSEVFDDYTTADNDNPTEDDFTKECVYWILETVKNNSDKIHFDYYN